MQWVRLKGVDNRGFIYIESRYKRMARASTTKGKCEEHACGSPTDFFPKIGLDQQDPKLGNELSL